MTPGRSKISVFPVLLILVFAGSSFWALRAVPQTTKPSQLQKRITLDLPVTPHGLVKTLTGLSAATRTPFAIEVFVSPTPRDKKTNQSDRYYDLTGLLVPTVLERIEGFAPEFEFSTDHGIAHVRPTRFRNNRNVALNRRVTGFDLHASDIRDALFAVHQIFDPGYPGHRVSGPKHVPDRLVKLFMKPVQISLQEGTVREILDEMIRQYGAASWVAEYTDPNGAYRGLSLSLHGFDNWSVSAATRAR